MATDNTNEETSRNIDALNKIEAESTTGTFAGTNSDKKPDGDQTNNPDNPIQDQEAQNVTDGSTPRLSGQEAEDAIRKGTAGPR